MAVTLFRANKVVRPYKSDSTVHGIQADAGYTQVGFLLEYLKMPDLPHSITSFANERFIRCAAGTVLLIIDRESFNMKFITADKQDLADRKFW